MTNNEERSHANVDTTAGVEMTTQIHMWSITEGKINRVGDVT